MTLAQAIADLVEEVKRVPSLVTAQISKWNGQVQAKIGELESWKNNYLSVWDGRIGSVLHGVNVFHSFDENGLDDLYIHIKTKLRQDRDNKMFWFKVYGYAERNAQSVEATFSGYVYHEGDAILLKSAIGSHEPYIYLSSDGYLTFRLKVNPYYLTLSVDGMRVGNGDMPQRGDLTFIPSVDETI